MLKLYRQFKNSPSTTATFFRFAGVGLGISLVDIALLYVLMGIDFFNLLICRSISLSSAMLVGYFLNRYFTFHHIEIGRALWHSIIRHFSVHSVGGILNMLIFLACIKLSTFLKLDPIFTPFTPLIAVWVGGISGLSFNFFFSKKVVFDS
ncbi:MAG: hypothetical protein CML12_02075 [Puniceicoccaceae bacterium]|nr:hypothetical protein [Puniceicoccaceae bacterium]|tara:strand:+ start:120 stop:569 length:450 start_codon:yes stop_codon:yes gene_type:complete